MPVIKSAIKKLRRDKKLERENDAFRGTLEHAIKTAQKSRAKKDVSFAFSMIDKAVKKHLIHKNKAARLKSKFAEKVTKERPVSTTEKAKTPVKKAATTTKKSPVKTPKTK